MRATDVTRSLAGKLRHEGPRGTARRIVRRAYDKLGVAALDFPLLPGDVADSTRLRPRAGTPRDPARPLTVGWLATPPSAGSGGHTTMFRMIAALERAGHRCVILLYDRHHGDPEAQAAVIRACWPWVRAEAVAFDDGIAGVDVCVATGWQTAHVLARRAEELDVHRAYLVQDFEPFFFPHGSEYELAADSYRFGFALLALGHMVQDRIHSEIGVDSDFVPFSCDTEVYSLGGDGARSGVVFYAKPDVARRGYRLGALALEDFHRRHPEQPIHLYGDPVPELAIPVIRHSRLTPEGLNKLYNRTIAGLGLSFTNISLVAEEMLAAGCIPVVNDSADSRADLDNPCVAWAPPTPAALSDALCRAVEAPDVAQRAAAAAAGVRRDSWTGSGEDVVRIIEDVAFARPARRLSAI